MPKQKQRHALLAAVSQTGCRVPEMLAIFDQLSAENVANSSQNKSPDGDGHHVIESDEFTNPKDGPYVYHSNAYRTYKGISEQIDESGYSEFYSFAEYPGIRLLNVNLGDHYAE